MKKIINIALKSAVPLLLGAVILFYIYRNFDFAQVSEAVGGMNMWWFALSCVFGVLSHMIRGWRWRLPLSPLGYSPRSSTCIYSIFIAYAANLVVPRIGEVSRCVVLDRYESVPFVQSLGTLVSERLVDTLMVLLIMLVAITSQWQVFYSFLIESGVDASGNGLFSSMGRLVVLALSMIAIVLVLYIIIRKMSIWAKLRTFISRFMDGMSSLAKMKNFSLFAWETVGIWFCYFMQFYLCFFCFSFSSILSVWAALLLFVAGSIAVVVPTPNGAGPWHFAVISIMVLYGVSASDAAMFALIVHTSQTLLVALLGILGLIMLQIRR